MMVGTSSASSSTLSLSVVGDYLYFRTIRLRLSILFGLDEACFLVQFPCHVLYVGKYIAGYT